MRLPNLQGRRGVSCLLAMAMAFASPVAAQDGNCDASCVAARKAANPLADIQALITDNTISYSTGTTDDDSFNFQLQPVYAVPVGADANLVLRGIIPYIGVQPGAALPPGIPGPTPNSDLIEGLGDIVVQGFYAPKPAEGRPALGFGAQASLKTRSKDSLAGAGWGAGPAFVIFGQAGNLSWGAVAAHMWGGDGFSTTILQPIISYGLGQGWYIGYNNVISYNWKATGGAEPWQVPIGLYGGRTIAFGDEGRAVDLNLGYYEVTRAPTGGPDRQLKFGISFFF